MSALHQGRVDAFYLFDTTPCRSEDISVRLDMKQCVKGSPHEKAMQALSRTKAPLSPLLVKRLFDFETDKACPSRDNLSIIVQDVDGRELLGYCTSARKHSDTTHAAEDAKLLPFVIDGIICHRQHTMPILRCVVSVGFDYEETTSNDINTRAGGIGQAPCHSYLNPTHSHPLAAMCDQSFAGDGLPYGGGCLYHVARG